MESERTVVVAGASGAIGAAAVRQFATAGWRVVALSRRAPDELAGAEHLSLDLLDRDACRAALGGRGAGGAGGLAPSHVVFTALKERPGLVAGWTDRKLMAENLAMFEHCIDPLLASGAVEHVSLLQGTKAYGAHVGVTTPIPCKESAPRVEHDNFYFLQEDALRARAAEHGFGFTVWRPQVVFGDSIGSPMNPIPVLGVYGALLRERGLPLAYPGGERHVGEAVDADLIGRALVWAADAPSARDETFNVTNGDVFSWPDAWPTIADALGMEVGEPSPLRLSEDLPNRADEWAAIVARHGLRAPADVGAFVGDSPVYADILMRPFGPSPGLPTLVSTVKLRRAGFTECTDTAEMFARILRRLQERALLPPVN
jgi:nucleoside-diphosphate-sugar epimerase